MRGSPAAKRDLFYDLSTSRFGKAGLRILSRQVGRECGFHPLISREKGSGLHTSHGRKDLMPLHDSAHYLMLSVVSKAARFPIKGEYRVRYYATEDADRGMIFFRT